MRHITTTLLFLGLISVSFAQVKKGSSTKASKETSEAKKSETTTVGAEIHITLKPYKNEYVYIGSYYGTGKTLVDSTMVDENSKGVFKPGKKYTSGIYFVVGTQKDEKGKPGKMILFEFLMDDKQHFSLEGDTLKKEESSVTGSADNDLFKSYSEYSVIKGRLLTDLGNKFKKAPNKKDSSEIRGEIIKVNKELEAYKDDLVKKNPNSLLAMLLNAMKRPEYPSIPVVNGKADSLYPYHYVKDHYWDDVEFNDDRLLRTPFFEPKLDDYFKNLVVNDVDSIYKELKYIMLYARTGKEMYAYLLTKFTNEYINPKYMGQEKVFIKIYEDFYAKGDTTYLNPASRKTITDRYYSLVANQLGNPAPQLDLIDTTGNTVSLYRDVKSKFTFVVFWDPTCGHCKEELPRIDSMYRAKWKGLGMRIYSVNVSTAANTIEEMKKFVHDKKLDPTWIFAYQTKAARDEEQAAGQPNYRQLYDVYKTPTLYMLDDTKHIIAKALSIEQFDGILKEKLKNKK